jgi:hypothetical protein
MEWRERTRHRAKLTLVAKSRDIPADRLCSRLSLNTNTAEITAHRIPTGSAGLCMRRGVIEVIRAYVMKVVVARLTAYTTSQVDNFSNLTCITLPLGS